MVQPVRLLATLFGIAVIGAPVVAVGLFVVAITGDPGTCEADDRPIVYSEEAAAAYLLAWDGFQTTLNAGQPAIVTFTETEVTSRAQQWLDERDSPINDLRICFSDGMASASAKIDLPFVPGNTNVLVSGTLILTGETAVIQIDDLEVGGLPSLLSQPIERFVEDVLEDETIDLNLDHAYELSFAAGSVAVSATP